MASNCEDISAQMIELLYGELPADARASVDAHVAGCDRCRSELEGFEKTRALARRGLDEAPPARARAAIMQAAAAHLAAQAQPAARRAAAPDKVSLWDRLRARWAFPTLATVGAVAVFVVANRVFLNPERTMSRPTAVESHEEAPVVPVKPMAAPASSGLDREAAAAPRRFEEQAQAGARARATPRPTAAVAGDMKPAAGDDLDRLHKDAARRGTAHGSNKKGGGEPRGVFAEPPAPKAEALADKTRRDQPMDGRFAPPPPPREGGTTVKRKAPAAEPFEKEADEARAAAASPAGPSGLLGGAGAPRGKADGFGAGAAQAAPEAAAPAPAPARNEAAKRAISAPATAPVAQAAPAMAPAPPAPASVAKPRAKKSAEPAPEEAYAAEGDAKKEEKQSSSNLRGNANDTLLQRADRLFAEGRWTEAAAIYRELLRRDPHNDDAARWRRRLVAAETADVNERNANLAEKRNAETARTQKRAAPAKASKSSGKAAATDAAQ